MVKPIDEAPGAERLLGSGAKTARAQCNWDAFWHNRLLPPFCGEAREGEYSSSGVQLLVASRRTTMRVVYARCCGLDVHKKSISACLLTPDNQGGTQQQVRRFGTMTRDLLELSDWLVSNQVTHVAMENTGVYWKPVWNV